MPERPGTATVAAARALARPAARRAHASRSSTSTSRTSPTSRREPFAAGFAATPYHGEVAAADAALEPLLRPLLERAAAAARWWSSPPTTARRWASTASDPRHLRLRGRRCTCRSSSTRRALLPAARRREPVRHVDVLPTVLDAARHRRRPRTCRAAACCPSLAGRRGDAAPRLLRGALAVAQPRLGAAARRAATAALKYVDLPLPELYDLAADPGEAQNLAASRPQDLERLRGRLEPLRAARPRRRARRRRTRRRSSGCAPSATWPAASRARRRSATPRTTTPSA